MKLLGIVGTRTVDRLVEGSENAVIERVLSTPGRDLQSFTLSGIILRKAALFVLAPASAMAGFVPAHVQG